MSTAQATDMGRRERNNVERRARLLAVGRDLFDAQGFDATTMEQIAAAAGLSTRTVYNFFAAKVDLLSALLYEEIRVRLPEYLPDADLAHADPREGLLALVTAQVETMASLSKSEQKQVVARSIQVGSGSEAGRYSAEIDAFMRAAIRDLLQGYVAQGAVRDNLDPDVAAAVIFSVLNTLYMDWLQTETSFEDVLPTIGDYLDVVLGT